MNNVKLFFDIIGYISTTLVVIAFIAGLVMWSRGIIPALLRLGKGLSKREIAIFAASDHASSERVHVDRKPEPTCVCIAPAPSVIVLRFENALHVSAIRFR